MRKQILKKKFKNGLRNVKKELIRNIRLIPFYFLLAAFLIFALKSVPDYLITHVKPKHLTDSEAVAYFCTIIASFVTIIGIFLTLNHNQKMVQDQLKQNQEKFDEERRLSVLPVITICMLNGEVYGSNNLGSKDFLYEEIAINFKEKEVNIIAKFSEEVINLINSTKFSERTFFYQPYLFTNSGIGTAVNFQITLFKKLESGDDFLFKSIPINIKNGQDLKVSFFAQNLNFIGDEYIIVMDYQDIYSNSYKQEQPFQFFHRLKCCYLDNAINQMLLKDKALLDENVET